MTQATKSATSADKPEVSRRDFLGMFASGIFASLVAPAMLGEATPVHAAPSAQGGDIVPVVDLPEAAEGEHPVKRMMQDLQRALEKPMDQRKWGMVIDLRKCTGCNGCAVSCIQENKLPPGVVYRPVLTETTGTYPNIARRFVPRPCMHCEQPSCTPVCPVNATWKRSDGIVIVDYDMCIGCRACITACPYNARSFDAGRFYGDEEGGERQAYELIPSPKYKEDRIRTDGSSPIGNARKCHFCIHRIERGELPACTLSCMGRATYFGNLNDPQSLVSELIGKPNVMKIKEELGTKPQVFYLV